MAGDGLPNTRLWMPGVCGGVRKSTGCTDLNAAAIDILQWFVSRWHLEVTFQESRAHLGVETQSQRSDLAIMRTTTPALLGLF